MRYASPSVLRPIDGWVAAIIIVLCACWGLNQVAVKVANAGIPPILQAGLRSLLSGLLVWGWALWRGVPLFGRDGSLMAGLVVGVLFAFDFLLLYTGLALTTAARGVMFLYCSPFFLALGAHAFIPGDQLTRVKAGGLLAAFAGLIIALGEGFLDAPVAGASITGDLLCVGAAVTWAATTVVLRTTVLRHVSAEKALFYQLGISAPLLIAGSFLAGEGAPSFTEPRAVVAFAYTVVFVAFLSYVIWYWLLTRHSPTAMSVFSFLTPIFGAIAGAVILDEPLTSKMLIALALVAVGIYLVNRPGGARTGRA